MQQPQVLLSFSDQLYRRFLRAYPTEYRRGFSEEMAQVFRDLCRDVYEQRGLVGFIGLWLTTLLDLVKTALEERIKETTNMTKNKFFRLSGWALMVAGPLATIGFSVLNYEAAQFDAPNDALAPFNYFFDPFGGQDLVYEASPILLIFTAFSFYTVGLYTFRLRFGIGSGNAGNIFLWLATISGAVTTIVTIPMLVLSGESWWALWMYSLLGMFTGITLFGFWARTNRPLPLWNAVPLLAGIWFPLIYIFSLIDFDTVAIEFLWNASMWIMIAGSIALGYILQREDGTQAANT